MKKILILVSVLVVVFVSVPLSAFAATYEDIPSDILSNPRTILDFSNWIYVEYYLHCPSVSGRPDLKQQFFIASQNPMSVIFDVKSQSIKLTLVRDVVGQVIYAHRRETYTGSGGNTQLNEWCTVYGETYSLISDIVSLDYTFPPQDYIVLDDLSFRVITNGLVTTDGNVPEQPILDSIRDDIKLGVKILLPPNNYAQSQYDTMSMTVVYKVPCPSLDVIEDIKVKVDGYLSGTGEIDHQEHDVVGGYAYGYYRFVGQVGFGEHREIKITITDVYGKKWTDTVTVHTYEGFVDEDGDGIDDRTGWQDFWDYPDDWNRDKPEVGLTDLSNLMSGVADFFSNLWGIIPQPVYVVLVAGITLLIAVGVLRAVLG